LRIDLQPWQGPAGLGEEYRKAHTANPALKDSMVRYVVALIEPSPGKPGKLGPEEDPVGSTRRRSRTGRCSQLRYQRSTRVARARGQNASIVRPWMVARGVIPGH
jgi:hypothetical protein